MTVIEKMVIISCNTVCYSFDVYITHKYKIKISPGSKVIKNIWEYT